MSPAATLLVASLAAALVTMAVSLNVTSARPEPTSSGGGNVSEGAQDRPPDYYSAYEYPDVPLNDTAAGPVEPGVIPDPSLQQDESEEPPVELPDDSLADTDLHDHDLIDSVVYIYFGGKPRERRGAGRQVVVAAAALALVAQLLTLAAALRRLKASPRDAAAAILLNTELSLIAGGLAMLLGVQATRDHQWCQGFALLLHYLNLVTCCWLLTISVHNLQRLQSDTPPSGCLLHISCALSWVLPALVVLGCFLEDPRSYETRHYCFMSVERGMLVSYMVPVSSLIVANTVLTVCSLRLVSRDEMLKPQEFEDETRFALRFSAALLPLYAVGWFLVVVALENPDTLVLSLLYGTVANFINWFMMGCSSKILPPSVCPGGDGLVLLEDAAAKALRAGADCQPLLDRDITSLVWGPPPQSPTPSLSLGLSHLPLGGEVLELRLDAISTISS